LKPHCDVDRANCGARDNREITVFVNVSFAPGFGAEVFAFQLFNL
jgi:hypothetical protein